MQGDPTLSQGRAICSHTLGACGQHEAPVSPSMCAVRTGNSAINSSRAAIAQLAACASHKPKVVRHEAPASSSIKVVRRAAKLIDSSRAAISQLVARRSHNPMVVSSILTRRILAGYNLPPKWRPPGGAAAGEAGRRGSRPPGWARWEPAAGKAGRRVRRPPGAPAAGGAGRRPPGAPAARGAGRRESRRPARPPGKPLPSAMGPYAPAAHYAALGNACSVIVRLVPNMILMWIVSKNASAQKEKGLLRELNPGPLAP